ncbi:MAG: type IV pilus biogenesis/stability protein PilW [Burkholderiales bacterium RIFCSPHIGHO2_12_FULL_69_20]|nr:MAG: type IV pilus biogenesis/stability protein PilW [Burkholderiales bacterium RIFCSPHIGHO2_12_FULL_69_20]
MQAGCRLGSVALVLAAAGLLAACAGVGGALPPDQPNAIATVSDQTDVERRARVRLELAEAYFGRGQLETALDEVKRSIAVKPDMADAYNLRALIYAAMREDRLAEDSFARALQLNPRDGAALHNQAWFLCQRDRFAEAQAQFSVALALPQYRDTARTQLARGVCYGRNQQWPEAEAALMRAYELEPSNPSIGFNLSEVLYQRQAYERASFYISRVNDVPQAVNAQTLWLAARIERKLGRDAAVRVLGSRLRQGFAQSPEAALFERGRFDD